MTPPPPPPPLGAARGPPPPMPPQLQAMMRQMQKRQPKFQQETQPPRQNQQQQNQRQGGRGGHREGRGHSGRGRGGRGQGRGGFQRSSRQHYGPQFKRKRGPSDDARDGSRFFMPSFLEDPWMRLQTSSARGDGGRGAAMERQGGRQQQRGEMRPRQVQQQQYAVEDGPGKVFFQPSFLEDPWTQLVR